METRLVPSRKVAGPIQVRPPGSKSITNRCLVMAACCNSPTRLLFPLESDDTRFASQALEQLGFRIQREPNTWTVTPPSDALETRTQPAELFLGNAGTAVRFMTAMLCARGVPCRIDGTPRMRERPIGPLLEGLRALGGEVVDELGTGCPPLRIGPAGLAGGETALSGEISSQFFSGLLIGAPFARSDVIVRVQGEWLSRPYIEMTQQMLASFGIEAALSFDSMRVRAPQSFRSPGEFEIEPDASAGTYPLALGVLHGVAVTLDGLGSRSLQGDVRFCDFLQQMGCRVEMAPHKLRIVPPTDGVLKPVSANLGGIPDAAMTLVALLAVTPGASQLRGLRNLRLKESDRIAALETELNKMGAKIRAHADGFDIEGIALDQLRPARVATYDDHRIAMCLALLGTLTPGTVIEDPGCVAKTYPEFWDDLERWLG